MKMKSQTAFCAAFALFALRVRSQLSQPNPCVRYAHSTTIGASTRNSDPHSTLYIYGGDAKTANSQAAQTENTRTNALIALDLTANFSIANPQLRLVQADNGNAYDPPQTSLGALFPSQDGKDLYYYGGYFGDNPNVTPNPQKLFRYNIDSNAWSTGSASNDDSILRSSGGGGAVIPAEGSSSQPVFAYFGGHLDSYTAPGWSNQIERLYLSSMVEYEIGSNAWTNKTTYSATSSVSQNSTSELSPLARGDSTLTFVPGLGTNGQGLLVSIGGGTLNQLMDNSLLDVYDIGAQGWSKQATQGSIIGPRSSHCAVRGSAKVNGQLHHQIFVYGGQAANRTTQILQGSNSDVFVLSIPSFTWTHVTDISGVPTGRSGHTCTLVGSQMLVVGGAVSEDLICDQPGIYVLDTTTLNFATSYTAGTTYTTPDHPDIAALSGGRGTGSSTSGSGYAIGTGADDEDTSRSFGRPQGDGNDNDGGGQMASAGGSNIGRIVGSVVAGIIVVLLIGALIWWLRRRRTRKAASLKAESEKPLDPTPDSRSTNPYEESWAADDVEEQTQGYNAQFAHLVPRQPLRVVNE